MRMCVGWGGGVCAWEYVCVGGGGGRNKGVKVSQS